jgi:hypothetical protein
MSQNARLALRLFASVLLAAIATTAIGVSTVFAGSIGPPFP